MERSFAGSPKKAITHHPAASMVAALKRQPKVAVGKVAGSNIFNIVGILGISSIFTPLSAPGIITLDLSFMIIFPVLLLPLAWTRNIVGLSSKRIE